MMAGTMINQSVNESVKAKQQPSTDMGMACTANCSMRMIINIKGEGVHDLQWQYITGQGR